MLTEKELKWIIASAKGTMFAKQRKIEEALDQDEICNELELEDEHLPRRAVEKLEKMMALKDG